MSSGPIDSYLEHLDRELRVKRAPRTRLLAETADHLRASADDLASRGLAPAEAEREAVMRFGAAAVVAGRFAHAAASSAVRSAVVWATTACAGYGAAALLFVLTAPSWARDFPQGAASMLALQIAVVALALAALRALSVRDELVVDARRLRLMANASFIAAGAVGAAAAIELVLALTRPAPAPWGEIAAIIGAYVVGAVAALSAVFVSATSVARAAALGSFPRPAGEQLSGRSLSLIDDIGSAAAPLARAGAWALGRPARTCAVVAASSFAAAAAVDGSTATGAAATGLFEAAAVVVSYLVLGRALGLRRAVAR